MAPAERQSDLFGQNDVKRFEVDHGRIGCRARATHRAFDAVKVPVVDVDAPVPGGESVPRVKRYGAREGTARRRAYHAMPIPTRSSGVNVYWLSEPVVFTALEWSTVPGCCEGSFEYDAG